MTIFGLKMMVKSGLEFFILKLNKRAPSEIPANLLDQFSLSGLIFLHLAAVSQKGLFTIIFKPEMVILKV
jgi:hypothetical protein